MRDQRLHITAHAFKRLCQRNLTVTDLLIAVEFGREIHPSNTRYFFLGLRSLPQGTERDLSRLVGTTVVVEGNEIVTAYRSRTAISKIKRQKRYYGGRGIAGKHAKEMDAMA